MPAAKKADALTESQERFAQEYLVDLNASGAYGRAYPDAKPKSCEAAGCRMLGNVKVAARVAELQAKRSARVEVTQDYVLRRLTDNVERALQVEQVLDREGNPTGEYVYAGAVVNGALNLLGKHLGMFAEKHEHSGPNGGPIEYQSLTPTERAHRLDQILNLARGRKISNGNGKHA